MKPCFFVLPGVACVALLLSCVSQFNRPPDRGGDYVVHTYHFCEKCESLQGGIYEKGPFKKFSGETRKECVHEWQEFSRDQFMQLAEKLYHIDWSKEPARFWNQDVNVGED